MEDEISQKRNQSIAAWITVFAIAITCCAILFYIFATSLSAINNNLTAANTRLTTMEQNETQLLYEIQSLRRSLAVNNAAAPNPAPVPAPAPSAAPPAQTPAAATTTTTPLAAQKTAVPEVPPTTH